MNTQLDAWRGAFGNSYTNRNQPHPAARVDAFRCLLPAVLNDVCEVGCNRGHNLIALRQLYGPDVYLAGVEPNGYARGIAKHNGLNVANGTIYRLPLEDASFDLMLCCGVLEHVPPDRLAAAICELHRVSARWLLAIEYPGDDEEIPYRGMAGMLWKRDYAQHFRRVFPDLQLLTVTADMPEFDGGTAWLFEKP